jgi:hypothetical protein
MQQLDPPRLIARPRTGCSVPKGSGFGEQNVNFFTRHLISPEIFEARTRVFGIIQVVLVERSPRQS